MSDLNTNKVSIKAIERDEPDLRRLARALIDLAIEQTQADEAAGSEVDAHVVASSNDGARNGDTGVADNDGKVDRRAA